jgi:membrane protease subunit HflC
MSRISIPLLIAVVVAILVVWSITYQVSYNQVAIRVRLGQVQETVTEPGLRFRWPPPIEFVQKYDARLRTMDAPEMEIKTADGKNVIIGTYAVWRIKEPLQFYQRARTEARAEEQMRTRIAQIQAAVVGQKTLPFFVNLDRAAVEANYDKLFAEMRDSIAPGLLADYGIALAEIGIRRISLPKEVTQEVFNSMIQERKAKAATYREEGKSQAEAIKARAEADARQILAFADRKASEIRSAGIQASTRILAKINESDREFFEWLGWLDTLKASFKQKSTIFIDEHSPLYGPFVQPPAGVDPNSLPRGAAVSAPVPAAPATH